MQEQFKLLSQARLPPTGSFNQRLGISAISAHSALKPCSHSTDQSMKADFLNLSKPYKPRTSPYQTCIHHDCKTWQAAARSLCSAFAFSKLIGHRKSFKMLNPNFLRIPISSENARQLFFVLRFGVCAACKCM